MNETEDYKNKVVSIIEKSEHEYQNDIPKWYLEIVKNIEDNTEDNLQKLENNPNLLGMYSFYDIEANRYDTPFSCQNDLLARRHHQILCQQENVLAMMPEKFNLVRIGFFHMRDGVFIAFPDVILLGKNYKKDKGVK